MNDLEAPSSAGSDLAETLTLAKNNNCKVKSIGFVNKSDDWTWTDTKTDKPCTVHIGDIIHYGNMVTVRLGSTLVTLNATQIKYIVWE